MVLGGGEGYHELQSVEGVLGEQPQRSQHPLRVLVLAEPKALGLVRRGVLRPLPAPYGAAQLGTQTSQLRVNSESTPSQLPVN